MRPSVERDDADVAFPPLVAVGQSEVVQEAERGVLAAVAAVRPGGASPLVDALIRRRGSKDRRCHAHWRSPRLSLRSTPFRFPGLVAGTSCVRNRTPGTRRTTPGPPLASVSLGRQFPFHQTGQQAPERTPLLAARSASCPTESAAVYSPRFCRRRRQVIGTHPPFRTGKRLPEWAAWGRGRRCGIRQADQRSWTRAFMAAAASATEPPPFTAIVSIYSTE